ncbi:hypothetical protein ABTE52_21815, partial [Acinetobacter baumannii]
MSVVEAPVVQAPVAEIPLVDAPLAETPATAHVAPAAADAALETPARFSWRLDASSRFTAIDPAVVA